MPRAPKSVDQVADDSTDLHTRVLRNRKIPTTKMAPPPEIKKDKPKPRHACNRLKDGKNICSVSVTGGDHSLLEDQVEGAPMEEDTGEAEAEAEAEAEVEVNVPADEGSQRPDDGASQLPDDEDQDDSESSLPPSSPPAEDSSSDAEDEFPPRRPGRRVEHKPKSKGKSRAMDVDDSDITGNLSHAALDEIRDFATEVKAKAEELGRRHGKSPRDILVAAGLSVKPSHTKLNEANLFRSWYWATQPKPDGADRNMVNNIITAEYNQLMKDIPKDDTAARKEKLKAVYEWSESSSAVPANKSVKSIAVRVHNAKTQFSDWTPDLWHIWWFRYHTKYTAIFKCLRDGNGTEAGLLRTSASASSAPALELHCRMKEIPRDRNRRVFGSMMKEKLITALQDLRTDALRQLVVPYLRRKLGSMYDGQSDDDDDEKNDRLDGVPEVEIKPWNEDVISIRDVHPLKGEIALVKAPDGTVLRKVSDDPEWQKSREEEDPAESHFHRKRPRVEVTDNDTVPREASRSDRQMPLHDEGRDACPIAGDRGVVIYPAAFWSKLTGDMHRMHFVTHQHTQATRTLESPVDLSPLAGSRYGDLHRDAVPSRSHLRTLALLSSFHHLGVMRTLVMTAPTIMFLAPPIFPTMYYHPARHGSGRFPPSRQTYRIPSRPDHHVYHDAPYISDYYPPAQPTAQQWVDRGSAAQNTCLFFRDRVSRKMHLLKILVTVSNGQGLCDCFSLIGFFHMVRGVARLESKD
ncbi:hypothetical protein BKA82DRAFT_4019030 [Pisolithus tinctorius]|nr:hypothetical protein BKA82DRAFT_4019030 [Pisolithus tinctorius]